MQIYTAPLAIPLAIYIPAASVGGTASCTIAALAPSTRLISSVAFARINSYVAFAIATPVACSVNARCEADAHVLAGCSNLPEGLLVLRSGVTAPSLDLLPEKETGRLGASLGRRLCGSSLRARGGGGGPKPRSCTAQLSTALLALAECHFRQSLPDCLI